MAAHRKLSISIPATHITFIEERPTVSIMMAHVGCCCIRSSERIKKRKTRSVDCIVALKWNECQEQFERFLFSCAKIPFLFKEKLAIKRKRYSHSVCVSFFSTFITLKR